MNSAKRWARWEKPSHFDSRIGDNGGRAWAGDGGGDTQGGVGEEGLNWALRMILPINAYEYAMLAGDAGV